jgi:four helix bundle protein
VDKQTTPKTKINHFTDLITWQEGHSLVIEIYKITKNFPRSEMFGLVNQMRRCVVSITSNTAEGFSRRNKKEKMQFYYVSLGSTTELQNQLIIARDLGYIEGSEYSIMTDRTMKIHKLLNGLIKSSQSRS